jgi:glycerophosphoryl diester phosphodiesterase
VNPVQLSNEVRDPPVIPYNIAHRGASARAPENTFAAFDAALSLGADMIELDLQMTVDGVLVAIHDDSLERTCSPVGYPGKHRTASQLSLDQLKRHDVGSWFNDAVPRRAKPSFEGLTVPTLGEIFVRYRNRARFLLELKHPELWPRSPLDVVSMIRDFGLSAHTADGGIGVATSSRRTLAALHRKAPELQLLQLFALGEAPPALAKLSRPARWVSGLAVCAPDVDGALINAARAFWS